MISIQVFNQIKEIATHTQKLSKSLNFVLTHNGTDTQKLDTKLVTQLMVPKGLNDHTKHPSLH